MLNRRSSEDYLSNSSASANYSANKVVSRQSSFANQNIRDQRHESRLKKQSSQLEQTVDDCKFETEGLAQYAIRGNKKLRSESDSTQDAVEIAHERLTEKFE